MPKRLALIVFILVLAIGLTSYFARHDLKNLVQKAITLIFQNKASDNSHTQPVKITFLDIGQGDATFIEWPSGEQMLVDCSLDARILEALGRVMSWHDHTIDYLVATHPDQDHYGGCVDVLKRYEVKHIIFNGYKKENSQYLPVFLEHIQQEKSQYTEINHEHTWTMASTTLHWLFPDTSLDQSEALKDLPAKKISNNTSIVFLLQYGNKKVLFTGDAEVEAEAYLLKKYGSTLDSDVLKVGHHGSQTSSGEDWLRIVTPEIAVISSGKDNDYGHPSPRVLKRLERVHSHIWRTDEKGDIILQMFPDRLYVHSQ